MARRLVQVLSSIQNFQLRLGSYIFKNTLLHYSCRFVVCPGVIDWTFSRSIHIQNSNKLKMDNITYLESTTANELDKELMSNDVGYSVDQLMELAGLSVAQAIYYTYPPHSHHRVLVLCGPGNNGGDGLVAARHLYHFKYQDLVVVYPKLQYVMELESSALYKRLVRQLDHNGIKIVATLDEAIGSVCKHSGSYDLVVDALFGFGFKGDVRQPYADIIQRTNEMNAPIVAVDVPSGWDVDEGPKEGRTQITHPSMIISLTAPKKCLKAKSLPSNIVHVLGGRFVPKSLVEKYNLKLPEFKGAEQFVCL